MSAPKLAYERRLDLVAQLRADGRLSAAAAAAAHGASIETIRKDLIALEAQGLAKRVHGGAIPLHVSTFEPDIASRTSEMGEKRRIAQAALAHVPWGGSMFIDAGSTTGVFAELLPAGRAVTVFTNSLGVAASLASKPGVSCTTLGGRVRPTTLAEVGAWAARSLAELRVDTAFVGTNAVSAVRGLSTPDADEAAIKGLMLEAAATRVLLTDHTKFGEESLVKYAGIDRLDRIITGNELTATERAWLSGTTVEVEFA